MYTECPECQTTFRLTAQALRQAHGRVRCGGCGSAFNALDNLSEEPPAPNLSDTQTAKIFEEESRALLESLDELSGDDDVRIEDTGAEWKVVDDDIADEAAGETDDAADDEPGASGDIAGGDRPSSGAGHTRWTFVDTPPADDARAADPAAGEATALVGEAPQGALDLGHVSAAGEELRFDDNTPLPDEYFRPVTGAGETLPAPRRRATDRQEFSVSQPATDSPQVDLELDDDDWRELLAEVDGDEQAAGTGDGTIAADAAPRDARDEDEDRDTGAPDAGDAGQPDEDLRAAPELESDGEEPAAIAEADSGDAGADDDTVEAAISDLEVAAALDEDDAVSVAGTEEARREQPDAGTGGDAAAPEAVADEDTIGADSEIDRELLQAAASGDISAASGDSRYRLWDEDPSLVETIVMEGDTITDTLSEDGAGEPGDQQGAGEASAEADAGLELAGANLAAGGARKATAMTPRQRYLGIAAIVLLGLLLAGQVVHANRESLATSRLFDRTLAPLYAAFGQPVTPAWDIRGWQFESTSGSTDESGSRLTIYSRIANRAGAALPYPLVHVSLTDRFDEVIGSRLLAPGEYLAGNGIIDRPVAAGDGFTAVITVDAPSPDATGFKLNVCYPVAGRRVRCAIEDFRD